MSPIISLNMPESAKEAPPRIYILIENPSKSNNLGPILRCGAAYSATFVFIGYQQCATEGSHGANKHVEIVAFPTFPRAVDYLKSCGVGSIIGILGDASFRKGDNDDSREVIDDPDFNIVKAGSEIYSSSTTQCEKKYPCSQPIHSRPFKKDENVCFSISRKSIGIPMEQGKYCDYFVHVSTAAPFSSHDGADGDQVIYGLLDAQTSLSICLHHYAAFAGYEERDFVGQKFQVAARTAGKDDEQSRIVKEERLQRKMEEEQDVDDAWENGDMASMIDIFG